MSTVTLTLLGACLTAVGVTYYLAIKVMETFTAIPLAY